MTAQTQTQVKLEKDKTYMLENPIDGHPMLKYIGNVHFDNLSSAPDRAAFVSVKHPDTYFFIDSSCFVEMNGISIKTHGISYFTESKSHLSDESKLIKMLEALGEKL